MKQKELTRRMGELDHQLDAKHTLIPLSASLLAKGVDGRSDIRIDRLPHFDFLGTVLTSTPMLSH